MPSHRKYEAIFRHLCNERGDYFIERIMILLMSISGAFLLWNPPWSPDLNPIEKFWDVLLALISRCSHDLNIGTHNGIPRAFTMADFFHELDVCRLSTDAYDCVFQ